MEPVVETCGTVSDYILGVNGWLFLHFKKCSTYKISGWGKRLQPSHSLEENAKRKGFSKGEAVHNILQLELVES